MIRAYDIGHALHERLLRATHDLSELGRQALPRDRPLLLPRLRVRHAGRHRDAAPVAVPVGHDLVERGRALGEVRVVDEIDEALARLDRPVLPRDQVRQDLHAGPVEEREPLAERLPGLRARLVLRERAPQGAVACELSLYARV